MIKGSIEELISVNPKVKLEKGQEYPFISMDIVQPYYKPVYPLEKREFKSGGSKFEEGDTLFARITPCLENGKTAQVKGLENRKGFGSTEFFVLRGKEGITNNEFVYYLTIDKDFRKSAEKLMTGTSGRQRVDKQQFLKQIIEIPNIDEQVKISSILKGLDDKIELNNKMNQTLEEMAMTLYKNWFVDFGPFKDGEFVDSELGRIPKGWEVVSLKDVVTTKYGYTASASDEKVGPHFLRITDIQDNFISWKDVPYCEIDEDNFNKYRLQKGDVVIARTGNSTGTVGYINSFVNAVYASFLVRLKPKTRDLSTHFLYLLTVSSDYQNYLLGAASGTTRKGANAKLMTEYKLVLPPGNVMEDFHSSVDSLLEQIELNLMENTVLTKVRDLVLPKLLSGEIDLSEADEHVREITQ
ncbi:restriction endonuclease subunit S [Aquisalibacillus elongatus]|uniref:Type I restriction enzyme S subunit n=1 Tax=Aquisalibacillus elongatus TaxID=485577 RepID=A0A3N5BGY5_9BACI|nr:restriction endonuclease subunit S [Aquisalibacillus elongatus]RPF57026.1 type I restriction enzyme S subunit [Aquisalibacillus elongatus]